MLQGWKTCLYGSAPKRFMLKTSTQVVLKRQISLSRLLCDSYLKGPLPSEKLKGLLENAQVEDNSEPTSPESVWLTNPYKRMRRDQTQLAYRPEGDPSEWSIILFPGQGTQYVGMAKSALYLQTVKDMFDIASEILGWDLQKLCTKGPKDELDRTDKAQPAIFVSSLAALEMMNKKEPHRVQKCIGTAGFSVGEYAALVFGGAISFEDAVSLVKVRGEAMQFASELVPSGMMTVILNHKSQLDVACNEAVKWCTDLGLEQPVCTVANYMFPHCKVIAGHNKALEFVEKNAKTYNLIRCKRLPVAGAFHTSLMRPALEPFKKKISEMDLRKPLISVHSNIDGKRYTSGFHVSRLLIKQIVSPVKWEQTLHVLTEYKKDSNLPSVYECGPGKSLSTILRMVNNKVECNSYEV